MVENGTKLEVNIFVLTVQQEKKGACAGRLLHTMLKASEVLNNIYYCLKLTESCMMPSIFID